MNIKLYKQDKGIDNLYGKLTAITERKKMINNFCIENDILTIEFANGDIFSSPWETLEITHFYDNHNERHQYKLKNPQGETKTISCIHFNAFSDEDIEKIHNTLMSCPNLKESKWTYIIYALILIGGIITYFFV